MSNNLNNNPIIEIGPTISVEHLDALKRTLNTSNITQKKEVIVTLTEILKSYKNALANKTQGFPDLPKIILQVDMIHAISQVMATSDAELFRFGDFKKYAGESIFCTLNLLNSIYEVPVLRGKLGIVVEAGLRIASIVVKSDYAVIAKARQFFLEVLKDFENVPLPIQRQIIAVYRKLPLWLNTEELLEWTQLLLFCPSLLDSLPQKVYTDFVKVLIAHQAMDKIGSKCLSFLADSFKKLSLRSVREICTSYNDFLKLLNDQISRSCPENTTEEGFMEMLCSFQIVYRYILAVGSFKEKVGENVYVIKWNLTKCIPSLMQYALGDAILVLVTELLHQNFKTEVLIVEENQDPNALAEVLSTIHFVALSSVHKAIVIESQKTVWMFLDELFRFSDREPGQALRRFTPELNRWNLVTFSTVFQPSEPLVSHPIQFWKFVFEWVKLLAKQRKSLFKISTSCYSAFNYGTFVGTLQARIRSENLSSSFSSFSGQSGFQSVSTQSQQGSSPNMINYYSTHFSQTPTREKEEIIIKIGDICSRISDRSIDWDPKLIPPSPMSSSSDDDDDEGESFSQKVLQEKECINISSDSETCSESDLQL